MNALKTLAALSAALLLATGCATSPMGSASKPNITGPVPIMMAQVQLPENELMDIGIQRFGQSATNKKIAQRNAELGSTAEIRKAEGHFIPVHLKNTLQKTGYWGAVRVTPGPTDSVDVTVLGKILESNGYGLNLQVSPVGSDGRMWYTKHYASHSHKHAYQNTQRGERDAYQNVYNAISNDLLAYRSSLGSQELGRLRRLSQLKFAADLAPDAYGDTIGRNIDGTYFIRRLPAEGDPMFERLLAMREREYMVVDVINEHYEDYYNEMWEPYEQWRSISREEAENLQEVRTQARNRKLLGAAVLIGTVAAEVLTNGEVPSALTQIGVLGGIEAIRSGVSISQEAEMHKEALTELGESFGADIEPRVVTVEGKTLELRGTATEQYAQWRNLLRQIYAEETGFPVGPPSIDYQPPPANVPAPAPVRQYNPPRPAAPIASTQPLPRGVSPVPAPTPSGVSPRIETEGNRGSIVIPARSPAPKGPAGPVN